jgi:hypothetical protein
MNGLITFGGIHGCPFSGGAVALTNLGTALAPLFRDMNSTNVSSGQAGWGTGTVNGRQARGATWAPRCRATASAWPRWRRVRC